MFFYGVFSLLSLHRKARLWVVLSLGLKLRKACAFVGLKNELVLTLCKAQGVGLQAFVSL